MPPGVRAPALPPGIRTHPGPAGAASAPSGGYPSMSFAELDAKRGAPMTAWTDAEYDADGCDLGER